MVLLTAAAMGLAAVRVPLKMLPFDSKDRLLLVLDFDKGTTLERTDAAVRDFEAYLAGVPEVADYTSYAGLASPMDFNGLVRHYYLRQGDDVAQVQINLAGKKNRQQQSHAIGLRIRNDLAAIADKHHARMKLVETPPGPPVIASIVAEVYGQPDDGYEDLLEAADAVRARLAAEPSVDLDQVRERWEDRLHHRQGESRPRRRQYRSRSPARSTRLLGGKAVGVVRSQSERNPLRIRLRLPIDRRFERGRPGPGPRQGRLGPTRPAGGVGPVERRASTR